ncbi:uncharacterized protein LOC144161659 [Haemaphysalis longicornis]
MAAARIQRWALLLGAHQYKIEYKPGPDNQNADALSRLPLNTPEEVAVELPEYVHSLQQFDNTHLSSQVLRQMTSKDELLQAVRTFILNGWRRDRKGSDPRLQPYLSRKLELTVVHGLVYWGHRVIVPAAAREQMLELLHETHQGACAMKAVARTSVWSLNGMMILVVVDSHTKWIEAVTMTHATAEATITALREIFSRLGGQRKYAWPR